MAFLDQPSTPPNKHRRPAAKGKSRIQSRRDKHHSHGLSLSSNTRDSLVDNLLMSLDELGHLAQHNYSTYEEADKGRSSTLLHAMSSMNATTTTLTNTNHMTILPRSRSHTHSSSLSSDPQFPDSPASNFSSPAHKSRRSASSSNFGVHHSLRGRAAHAKDIFSKSQTHVAGNNHMRGYSDASSLDNGFVDALETPRISLGGPRSISMDQLQPMSQDSILHRGRPVPSVYSRYETPLDAAPEPTVPAGPRKMQNPNSTGPVYVNAAPKQSSLRKTTTQSDLRTVSSPTIPPEIREKASDFVRASNMQQTQSRKDTSPHRERPGFFKRVFGGGKNESHHEPKSTLTASKSESRQVSADHSVASSNPPPTLNKKPSSFFRRRKKSTSEADKQAQPPLPLNSEQSRQSVSSLRKVMDPYLHENKPVKDRKAWSRPETRESVVSDDLDIFHSGYTPPADASLRPFKPASRENESPRMKLKVKKRGPDDPPHTAPGRPSGSLEPFDSSLRERAQLTQIKINGDAQIEPPKVSPLSDLTPSVNGERRVSSLHGIENVTGSEDTQEMRDFAAGNNVDLTMNGSDWLIANDKKLADRPDSKRSQRLILQPSTEDLDKTPTQPSATQFPPIEAQDAATGAATSKEAEQAQSTPTDVDAGEEERLRARRIYDGVEQDIAKMEAASWLGESKPLNIKTLHEYMALYDFTQVNILTALRMLCGRLLLRGETQQFDRIITALSSRWCQCNPNNGFKAQDVVHTICYSVILLNTDLHLADIGEKMSRSAYVKNTLPTIRRVVADAAPNAFDGAKEPARPMLPWMDGSVPNSPSLPPDTPQDRTSFEGARTGVVSSNSARPNMSRAESDGLTQDSPASNALVSTPWTGSIRGWENEIEAILKSFYLSIRGDPLPLLGSNTEAMPSQNLSASTLGLKRSGSTVSKAKSDAMSGKTKGLRSLTLGWQGRYNRPRPPVFSTATMSSSRTSFDDNNSLWSPAQSSTWSKNSMGKTLTSTSMNSLAASYMTTDREFKHSIGFANALSHAIIREEGGGIINADSDSFTIKGDLLDDESLALEGAPWAKEGMVKHKHHLEAPDRKSKERSWNECFAVISRGKLTLFNFNTEVKTRSLGRPRTKQGQAASIAGSRVGGGDWMERAEQLAVFVLRHTISSTLPPPGYSKSRPYVWALSLPSGAVHLFQVGTPEIAEEWMTTANYWSARLSKEPLSGGVSNIEYGWSEAVINPAVIERSESMNSPPPAILNRMNSHAHSSSNGTISRPSVQSSIRGSFDVGSNRQRLPGDKVHITEWTPPSQSIMASQLGEGDQLRSLTTYVTNVEQELEKHHDLKHAIELAVSISISACKDIADYELVLAPPFESQQSHDQLATQI